MAQRLGQSGGDGVTPIDLSTKPGEAHLLADTSRNRLQLSETLAVLMEDFRPSADRD